MNNLCRGKGPPTLALSSLKYILRALDADLPYVPLHGG